MKYCSATALDTLQTLPDSVTVCATVDDSGHEQVITELMIRRACEQMDKDQVWPYTDVNYMKPARTLPTRSATILPFERRNANSQL